MSLEMSTQVRKPPSLRGIPPRYQVFDRRKDPPMTVSQFYFDPEQDGVVFEVYDDPFREFLKEDPAFAGKRFDWMLDVAPDAPHDTRVAVVEPHPMPVATDHGPSGDPALTLDQAVAACSAPPGYRVIRTSDPV
ncbi:MAG TPA: hypothetical protein VM737_08210 [Gemmatimonadota bacterium]|nr:hypothetical protein [Gemmatimonadota bacterium]